ncbi:MAG TPA: hypothetical protein VMA75_03195 [Candidatus Paceibacterota bacterium]|nr:hypothetical protein [Candidatus Paceibacterota bacterium]
MEHPLVIVKNKFDGIDYRITVLPTERETSLPLEFYLKSEELEEFSELADDLMLEFKNLTFEAALFKSAHDIKPLFAFEYDEIYGHKTAEREFDNLMMNIVSNEKIEDLMDFKNNTIVTPYTKYGLRAIKIDLPVPLYLGTLRTIFLTKNF